MAANAPKTLYLMKPRGLNPHKNNHNSNSNVNTGQIRTRGGGGLLPCTKPSRMPSPSILKRLLRLTELQSVNFSANETLTLILCNVAGSKFGGMSAIYWHDMAFKLSFNSTTIKKITKND